DSRACPCGSDFRVIDRIEGRCDDILYFEDRKGGMRPFFPDTIRRMALLASDRITDYQAVQREPGELTLHLVAPDSSFAETAAAARDTLLRILDEYDCRPARICIERGLPSRAADAKRRRVQRLCEAPTVERTMGHA